MKLGDIERRGEPRFPVEPGTQIKVVCNGNFTRATAVDISETGILLQCLGPIRLVPGDRITCDIDDGDNIGSEPPSSGKVVRVQAPYVAVAFTSNLFARLRP
jgi:hypothetical protein